MRRPPIQERRRRAPSRAAGREYDAERERPPYRAPGSLPRGPAPAAIVERLLAGDGELWEVVREPPCEREIKSERARGVIEAGLRQARGRSEEVARPLGLEDDEDSRFVDFLRWSELELDFRPYRDAASSRRGGTAPLRRVS